MRIQSIAGPQQDGGSSQSPEEDVAMDDADPPSMVESVPKQEEAQSVKVEDLFADMDDDDLDNVDKDENTPPSSGSDSPAAAPTTSLNAIEMRASDPDVLRIFYQRLFPWRYLFQWLNHSPTPTNDFKHREFAFTLQNDAYLRYQSFPTADTLRKDVVNLVPSRFEIGPVYSTDPRERKTLRNASTFKPLSKELCFDIDLTDYDDIRTCCDKATICRKCWCFMTMAIKVLDIALRRDFGFKHVMWVYSGRRGAHAWVCDRAARNMTDQQRKAVAGYFQVVSGGSQSGKKVNLRRPLHPHLSRSLDILKQHFAEDVLEGQDPWRTPENAEKLLALLPDKSVTDALRQKWESDPSRSSSEKWADIDKAASAGGAKRLDLAVQKLRRAKTDIVFEYTYPRLDIEVSKKLNHLLKSPFVVHPGTGRVCVPINAKRPEDFDPLEVPTIQTLLAEIDEWKGNNEGEIEGAGGSQEDKVVHDWEKTSLKPYIEQFRSFVGALLRDEAHKGKRTRDEGEKMDF